MQKVTEEMDQAITKVKGKLEAGVKSDRLMNYQDTVLVAQAAVILREHNVNLCKTSLELVDYIDKLEHNLQAKKSLEEESMKLHDKRDEKP